MPTIDQDGNPIPGSGLDDLRLELADLGFGAPIRVEERPGGIHIIFFDADKMVESVGHLLHGDLNVVPDGVVFAIPVGEGWFGSDLPDDPDYLLLRGILSDLARQDLSALMEERLVREAIASKNSDDWPLWDNAEYVCDPRPSWMQWNQAPRSTRRERRGRTSTSSQSRTRSFLTRRSG